ncbi:hypothetical protein F4808DRAFT_405766 [Astrocystis sublimbata]|nr:hypothetical protein F4808DRAFT_405766 [Astrocystis sublimbata]
MPPTYYVLLLSVPLFVPVYAADALRGPCRYYTTTIASIRELEQISWTRKLCGRLNGSMHRSVSVDGCLLTSPFPVRILPLAIPTLTGVNGN